MQRNIHLALALGCFVLLIAGCSGPSSQLAAIQKDKEDLLATIRKQRDAGRALKEQVASLETRLDQAEKELAFRSGGTRISTRPQEKQSPVKGEPLPWRTPPGKSSASPGEPPSKSSSNAKSRPASLVALANRDRRVQVDPQAGAARLALPLEFSGGGATLTAQDKRQLDEVARLLRNEEARPLRIMIAAQDAERSQAVSDYLDSHGIAADRLSVASETGSRGPERDVQLVFLERGTSIAEAGGPRARR